MTRKKVLFDETIIRLNMQTKQRITRLRIQWGLGTIEEALEELLSHEENNTNQLKKRIEELLKSSEHIE